MYGARRAVVEDLYQEPTIDCQQIGRRTHAIHLVIVSYSAKCMNFGLCSPFKGDRVGFGRLS